METTEPLDGNNFEAVADSLIMNTPENPDEATEEVVEETVDEQPEAIEADAEGQDDVEMSDDDLDFDIEDVEVEEPEVEQEPLYTVKVDGKEKQVSLDELTRGYSGQEYIQKGMAENAEARKEVEQIREAANYERQQLQAMMQRLQQEGVPPIPEYPSEELRVSDPLGYLEAEADYRRAMDKRMQFEQQAKALGEQQQAQERQQQAQRLEQEAARLAEWMPEFADPQKRDALMKDITVKAKSITR